MKERPIIFSAPMVRAILEGKKTQTRRVVKRQGDMEFDCADPHFGPYWLPYATEADGEDAKVRCPYGEPGDRLWVRETWQVIRGHEETESWEMPHIRWFEVTDWPLTIPKSLPEGHCKRYAADGWTEDEREDMEKPYPWRSPMFMPRWASRITLEITKVRVERLQSITDEDAQAEGIRELPLQEGQPGAWWAADPTHPEMHGRSPVNAYARLWQSINGPDSWEANPWVWVISVARV